MHQLHISQEFDAPVAKLYQAWTDPALMSNWFAPGELRVQQVSAEPVVGGAFRVVMEEPEGELHTVNGTYQQIDPNEKLVFSWKWESGTETTRVELRFKALSDSRSQLDLIHSEFADKENCEHHYQGWNGCLAKLRTLTEQ